MVAAWWDLEALEATYVAYLGRFSGVADRWADGDPADADRDRAGFADYVAAVTARRRLPYLDPGLPLDALPDGWIGGRAEALFARLRALLAEPAAPHVRRVVQT